MTPFIAGFGNELIKVAEASRLFGGRSAGGDPKKPTKAWGSKGGFSLLGRKPKSAVVKLKDTVSRDKPMTRVRTAAREPSKR